MVSITIFITVSDDPTSCPHSIYTLAILAYIPVIPDRFSTTIISGFNGRYELNQGRT
jgi:hypothetical protein